MVHRVVAVFVLLLVRRAAVADRRVLDAEELTLDDGAAFGQPGSRVVMDDAVLLLAGHHEEQDDNDQCALAHGMLPSARGC